MFLSRRRNVLISTPADKLMRRLRERAEAARIHNERIVNCRAVVAVFIARATALGGYNFTVTYEGPYTANVNYSATLTEEQWEPLRKLNEEARRRLGR